MIQIKPTFVISAGMDKINPYAKLGLLLATGTITETNTDTFGPSTNIEIIEYKGGLQMGFQGGLGVEFELSENLSIFGESNLTSLAYAPTESTITKNESNVLGLVVDNLVGADVEDIQTIYEDSVTTGLPTNPSEPSKSLKFNLPFGSLGVNFGVKYNF